MKCHVDGELRPVERAVSATDRGLLYGDAATETLRAVDGEPLLWEPHRERLDASCETLGIERPEDLRSRVVTTLAANDLSEALVRLSITRGTGSVGSDGVDRSERDTTGGLTPPADPEPTVLVTVEPVAPIRKAGTEPARLQTVKTKPIPEDAIPRRAHSHCRLDRVLGRRELVDDADEALLLTRSGTVAGCAGSALVVVADDSVRVRPTDDVVPRAMRTVALDLAREEGIPIATAELVPADVRDAQEAFLANARWGIRPVATVDGIEVDPGPVTALLRQLLADRVDAT